MNLGIVTSYIIGGLILLAILTMNTSVSNSSIELTIRQTNQQKISAISDMISHDFHKMGYNLSNKTNPILLEADHDKIVFTSNIDQSTDKSVEKITWEFTDNEVTGTENPDDYILKRTVHDYDTGSLVEESSIELGVTNLNISYYTSYGASISDSLSTPLSSTERSEVKQFYIKINLESSEKIYNNSNSDGRYVLSVWEKRFSPLNLQTTN